METTTVYSGIYWGYKGIMEKKVETTHNMMGYILRSYSDNERENGNNYGRIVCIYTLNPKP